MNLSLETLLIILASCSALAIVGQFVLLWTTVTTLSRFLESLERKSVMLQREATQLLAQLKLVASGLQPLIGISDELRKRTDEITRLVDARSQDLDELVGELVSVGRKQAAKVDEAVTDTVEKFEQTTLIFQQDIIRPLIEVASFVKGLRSGLGYLFSKKASITPDEGFVETEEELFI